MIRKLNPNRSLHSIHSGNNKKPGNKSFLSKEDPSIDRHQHHQLIQKLFEKAQATTKVLDNN
jgi:hypothetical protein